jgi:phenylacetate-CoA ligase
MRNFLWRLGLKLSGKDIFAAFARLKVVSGLPLSEVRDYQEKLLADVLLHAWKYVPYYRKILADCGAVVDGAVNLGNFNRIPVLTKEIIRNNFDDLRSRDPNYARRKPFLNTSGGSTGEPVRFIQDKMSWTEGMANKWLFYSFVCDYPCRLVKLWGSERDILHGGIGFRAKIKNYISQRVLLNSFRMSEADMFRFVKTINDCRPDIIEAYVQSVFELSKFIEEKGLTIWKPKGIITSAGTLYPAMEETIGRIFGCPVFNRYGSREVGDMACGDQSGRGLRLSVWSQFLEILDDKFQPAAPGQLGKIYVTTLNNYSMPLIRYDIGDIGVVSDDPFYISKVEGREMDMIQATGGRMVPAEFFIHFVGVVYNKGYISRFQVIQREAGAIIIKVVLRNREGFRQSKSDIELAIRKVMGQVRIVWEEVNDIPPSKSGKYRYVINELT